MPTPLIRRFLAAAVLTATVPAFADDHGPLPSGHDDATYGDAPAASAWASTRDPAERDDGKMSPPRPPARKIAKEYARPVDIDGRMVPVETADAGAAR
jgi:hypothetical protein